LARGGNCHSHSATAYGRALDAERGGQYADKRMSAWSKKILVVVAGLVVLGFVIYRSSGFINLADFSGAKLWLVTRNANPYYLLLSLFGIYACYALRALRWQVLQRNLGPSSFWTIYKLTLAGFSAIFLLGRAGEPIRPLLLARKEKLPVADMFGLFVLERLFDTASTAVIAGLGLLLFQARTQQSAGQPGGASTTLAAAAKTTGSLLFAGVLGAIVVLVDLRLHGTALLERRLQGWRTSHGWRHKVAGIILGFARGVQTIRTWGELGLAVLYSGLHWVGVAVIYVWISHSLGGKLLTIGLGDALLVLAFTMVGSAVQLPGVGGGSQLACFLAYTTIFGVEKEPAAAAAILIWLITFAGCSLAGVPLLIHEGMSLGELRRMAEQEEKQVEQEEAAINAESGGDVNPKRPDAMARKGAATRKVLTAEDGSAARRESALPGDSIE
jgi:glycosyltransferase 2 family protein